MQTEPDPTPRPIDHLVELASDRGADTSPALVLRDRTLDHAALRQRVAMLAGWLQDRFPTPGARVASWVAKGELACLMPLAAARAGLIHVPINPLLKRAQVAHILGDCSATGLIATKARLATLEHGDSPSGCDLLEETDALALAEGAGLTAAPSTTDPADCAAILYTSGSTGRPKGVVLSHANLWLGAVSVAHYLGLAVDDVTLAVLPLSFDYGQNQLFSAWYAGGSVVPLDFLFPRDVVRACERHRITTLAAVPPLWVRVLEAEWSSAALSHMRRLTNSGGALGTKLVEDLVATFKDVDLYPMYGLTEAFRSTYLEPDLVARHPTSIGRAVPFAEIIVVNDDGDVAAPDEEGELVHCGPLVAQGYWRDPERTAHRFRPAPPQSRYGGTAVWSGDRVRRDENGLLYFVARRDAMIKSAGNRISPQEIEEAAIASGATTEAIAIGVPDERLGEAIHLIVRGSPNGDEENRLVKHLKSDLPNFMQPKVISWREEFPLNPNGKVDRAALGRGLETGDAG